MELKGLTALFTVALVAFGGIGVGVAMPEDVVDMDTPSERAWEYADKLKAIEADLIGYGFSATFIKQRMDIHMTRYADKLAKYTRMYYYINVTVLTTDCNCSGSEEVEDVAFTVNGYTFSLGPGVVSWYCDGSFTVDLSYYTIVQVKGTVTAFDGDEQTATLTDIVIVYGNGHEYNIYGSWGVSW